MSAGGTVSHDTRFAVFRSWVGTQQARAATSTKKRDQFSDKTALIYESLWRGWVEWLGARDRQWPEATAVDVRAFLDGPAPAPKDRRTRKPIQEARMANYTQQRYWSVLQAVYSHAATNGLVRQSPCMGITVKPQITQRSQTRQLMLPGVLQLLRDPGALERFLPMEDSRQWWVLRDRAAVALVAHCALSNGELIALRGRDLRDGAHMLGPADNAPELPGIEQAPSAPAIDVPAKGDRQARIIPIPPAAQAVLAPWLTRRAEVLQTQAKLFGATGRREAAPTLADAPLLLSREAPPAQPLPAIDPPTVYYNFRRCVDAAIEAAGHACDGGYVARGAAILRNSVIAEWARTLGNNRAAELAGLKLASLRANGRSQAKQPDRANTA